MGHFQGSIVIPAPIEHLFLFHTDPANLQSITPRFLTTLVLGREGYGFGSILRLQLAVFGHFHTTWVVRIDEYEEYSLITDVQLSGPLRFFVHSHRFERLSDKSTRMTDILYYYLPFGALGRLIDLLCVRWIVMGIFSFRHRVTKRIFEK